MFSSCVSVTSRRLAHTDVKFPDMSSYRRDVTLDTDKPARETEDQRRALPVAVYYGGESLPSNYNFFLS